MISDSKDYIQDGGVPKNSETHAGEDVGVHARGPFSHLIRRTHEQSYIAHVIIHAACLDGQTDAHCEIPLASNAVKMYSSVLTISAIVGMIRMFY